MLRYGRDYGRWNGQGRYDWERPGGYGHPYGGPRNDNWGVPRQNFGGEGAWMDEGYGSQPLRPGYDFDFGGGFGSGYGGGYGADYFSGRGGYGSWPGRGGGQQSGGGWDTGYGSGYGYEGGMDDGGERGGRSGGQGNAMRAADIMTEEPETVSPDTTLAEVAQKMRDLDVGIIPVVDGAQSRRLRGVVTDRDITIRATAEGKDARNTRVSEVMTTQVETVNKNDRVRDVLEVMRREQVKRVPVTDREGRLVGIIAEADLLAEYEGGERDRMVESTLERVYESGRSGRSQMRNRSASGGQAERGGRTRDEGREQGNRAQPEQRTTQPPGSGRGSPRKQPEQQDG